MIASQKTRKRGKRPRRKRTAKWAEDSRSIILSLRSVNWDLRVNMNFMTWLVEYMIKCYAGARMKKRSGEHSL
jgi:hypothetical protein